MKQLNKIAKLIQAEKSNEIAQRFIQDLNYTIEKENTSELGLINLVVYQVVKEACITR